MAMVVLGALALVGLAAAILLPANLISARPSSERAG
jgi:hypothetical protein